VRIGLAAKRIRLAIPRNGIGLAVLTGVRDLWTPPLEATGSTHLHECGDAEPTRSTLRRPPSGCIMLRQEGEVFGKLGPGAAHRRLWPSLLVIAIIGAVGMVMLILLGE
jgi:hypothetical protein